MQYWQFFPVPAEADGTAWGCIPVWGFGTVVQSRHPGVVVGERLYGYWPMASKAVLQPDKLSATSFSDGAPHRAALHAVYNQYQRVARDPFYTADTEALQALLRPLFLTAWLIDDFLADNAFFGSQAGGAARGAAAQFSQQQDRQRHRRHAGPTARCRGGGPDLGSACGLLRQPGLLQPRAAL